ncbi:response regulator [Azospirillum rugosum]|uniref:histidine kinase n=2 Tax=Azospirillum rugosum TaxID=416170 RepID=A0ABS4SIM3_9PROT|nr:cache domain-containing protein [Azospirillum rugosum]MBP2292069.1 PAS domain S-box-containing protein [Azospirillum rugosum]MDQ0525795.1 PAS domain S-box-containing protein [Azospirillum rugosum]
MLPVLAFVGWMVVRMAETQSAAIERSGQDTARMLAVAIDRELTAMATALQVLSTSPSLRSGDYAAFHATAIEVLRSKDVRREGVHIVLTEANGQQIANTRRAYGEPLPRTAVPDLVRRAAEASQTQISGVFRGAIAGQLLVAVAVPVVQDGQPTRVLSMSVPTDVLAGVLKRQELPGGWIAGLWDREGLFITRTAAPQSSAGTPVPPEVVRVTAAETSGTFPFVTRDGVRFFNAFARSDTSGWTVTVGVPQAVISEPLTQSVLLVLTGGGILLALSLMMALAVGRRIAGPVAALADSARALGRHGPSATTGIIERTPIREVNDVAGALASTAQRLRDSEAQQRLVMEAVGLGVWRFDARGGRFYGSDRTAELLGSAASDGTSIEAWIRNVSADYRDGLRSAFYRDGPAAGEFETEFPVGSPDGRVRWLMMRGSFLAEAAPGAARAVGILEDVTERRRAHEEQLGELVGRHAADRRLFAAIIESSTDLIVAVDQDLRILLFNGAYQREIESLYGRRPEIGRSLLDLMDGVPDAIDRARVLWGRALAGETFTIVEEIGNPALRRQRFELAFGTMVDSSGRRIGAFRIARDIGERERTQEALRQAEETLHQIRKMEAIGQLTGGIAHDFNNLLQAIGSALFLIQAGQDGASTGAGTAKALDLATEAVKKGATLTQHLLAFSRRQRLEPKSVNVGALVEGMSGLLERTLGGTIRIATESASGLWAARVDPNQLEMAILNLAINARDAMPDGGALTIATANCPAGSAGRPADLAPGDCVRIAVADTGQGMGEEVAARAFEPFFTTKGVGHGTGLGLSMVHGLAAQSGGTVTLDTAPGRGTTVTLYLPRADAQDATAPAEGSMGKALPPQCSATILVVEDEVLVRMGTATVLEQAGFRIMEASSGPEALEVMEREPEVDLVLTDYAMPGMTGLELIRALRTRRPDLPVLMVTGYAEIPKAASVDGLVIMQKPYRAEELVGRIRRTLAAPSILAAQ